MTAAFLPGPAPAATSTARAPWLARATRWLIPDRRDGIVALALLLGIWLSSTFGLIALLEDVKPELVVANAVNNFASSATFMLVIAIVARWAASWRVTGWRRHLLLAAAMAAALSVNAGLLLAAAGFIPDLYLGNALPVGVAFTSPAVVWSVSALWFPLGLLLAAQFQRSAQERSARARLDALLREQRQAQRRFAEARLQQIQSRIDPELLFEMLEHVRRLYPVDAARAEGLLDELIDFLRAVLPRLHSVSSTLGRELRIAASYLRLCELAGKSSGRLEAALPAEVAEAPFPPGLLLLIVASLLPCKDSLRVAAEQGERGYRVSLAAPQAPDPPALARVRAALDDLFGDRYLLDVAHAAGRSTVTLTVPDEDRRN